MNTENAITRLLSQRAWDAMQDEARIANDLQRDHPEMGRTEALKAAKELVEAAHIGEPK